ncbi:MAG: DUF4349 domain-containing protein [Clostridiales bacterium]|nr:DUF4349 domain-containing protein [Clostridiales bacterium]
MTCEKARELFSEHYDGGETAREEFEAHLRECADCAADYENFRKLFDEVRGIPAVPLPAGLREKMVSAVKDKAGASPPRKLPLRALAAGFSGIAASFILLALIVSGVTGLAETLRPRPAPFAGAPDFTAAPGRAARENNIEISTYSISEATAAPPANEPLAVARAESASVSDDMTEESLSVDRAIADAAPPAFAPSSPSPLAAGYFEQVFQIQLRVENLEEAKAAVGNLGGYNISSNANNGDYGGSAEYRRRVDMADYAQAVAALREIGDIESETETVYKLADEIYDLEARLTAKEKETERLKDLLSQSRTMEVLAAVERRLGAVETGRDEIRGRLNQLYTISARPSLIIHIYERYQPPAPLREETFQDRLGQSFIKSVNAFVEFMKDALVFFSGAFIPLLILGAVALTALRFVRRAKRGKEERRKNGDETENA